MKKNLLALAAALAAPLAAQAQSNVTVYGSLAVSFENVKMEGATSGAAALNSLVGAPGLTPANAPSRNRVTSTNSALGFRGSEDLGAGLKAIFQIESGVPMDGGPGPNTLASRNSNVGLAGNFGTVFLGTWDTPYKFVFIKLDSFNVFQANNEVLMGSPGFNVAGTTQSGRVGGVQDAAFVRRQGNSVQYWTPSWSGVSGRLAYSANEGKGTLGGANISPDIWSGALMYDNGPLYLAYAYERHNDYFGLNGMLPAARVSAIGAANGSSKDTGHRLGAGFTFGDTSLGLMLERLKYENEDSSNSPTAVREYRRDAWYLSLQQRFGPGTIRALYGRAGDGKCSLAGSGSCDTNDLRATHWALGYSHDLSKRTMLYAFYTRVNNDNAALYNLASGGAVAGAGVGADPQSIAVAVRHLF